MRFWPLLIAALGLTACNGTGPIYPVQDDLYDWVKAPEAVSPESDREPVVADPVVNFRLDRGERQSTVQVSEDLRPYRTYLLGFDVRLDRASLGRENVTLSRLSRRGDPSVEVVSVQLDAARGVTVMGRTCIAPADLADWHRVELRIKFSDRDRGYLEVFCDRRPIWARTEIRTTFPVVCRRRDGCDARVPQPVSYDWRTGLISNEGVAHRVMVQMRRLHYRPLIIKPNRVGTL